MMCNDFEVDSLWEWPSAIMAIAVAGLSPMATAAMNCRSHTKREAL